MRRVVLISLKGNHCFGLLGEEKEKKDEKAMKQVMSIKQNRLWTTPMYASQSLRSGIALLTFNLLLGQRLLDGR